MERVVLCYKAIPKVRGRIGALHWAVRRKATADPSTRPGTPGLAQDDNRFMFAQDDNRFMFAQDDNRFMFAQDDSAEGVGDTTENGDDSA